MGGISVLYKSLTPIQVVAEAAYINKDSKTMVEVCTVSARNSDHASTSPTRRLTTRAKIWAINSESGRERSEVESGFFSIVERVDLFGLYIMLSSCGGAEALVVQSTILHLAPPNSSWHVYESEACSAAESHPMPRR